VVKFPGSTLSKAVERLTQKLIGEEIKVEAPKKTSAIYRIRELLFGS
jgi:hypothetical protein